MKEVIVNGRKLRELRKNRDLTQGQLEIKSGVSQAHISRLEKGKRKNAEVDTVGRLADALGVGVSELLTEPIPIDELPPLRVYLERKYGVDVKTGQQLTDIIETLIYGWRRGQREEHSA